MTDLSRRGEVLPAGLTISKKSSHLYRFRDPQRLDRNDFLAPLNLAQVFRIQVRAFRQALLSRQLRDWRARARAARYSALALAKLCRVSERTLRRYFHDQLRTSLRDWLKRRRIHDAKEILRTGAIIKEAAHLAGYRNPTHFSRQFKFAIGTAPSAWNVARRSLQ